MSNITSLLALLIALAALAADDPAWKAKQVPDWSEDDAKDLLAQSPWVKSFTPTMKQQDIGSRRGGFGGGGLGGIGIGMPGMGGIGGRRGMGGGGYPGGSGYPG